MLKNDKLKIVDLDLKQVNLISGKTLLTGHFFMFLWTFNAYHRTRYLSL